MAHKRRTETNIRKELIAAELERLRKENAELRGLLWEFLSTHCAPLELRERATAAVGKPPLTFSTKEQDLEKISGDWLTSESAGVSFRRQIARDALRDTESQP